MKFLIAEVKRLGAGWTGANVDNLMLNTKLKQAEDAAWNNYKANEIRKEVK
jgi:hypothetical protein